MISKAYRCTATKLQRRGNNVSVAETNTKATVCTLGGLQSGAEYLLAVRAINSVSRSAAAELTIVMPGGGQLVRFTVPVPITWFTQICCHEKFEFCIAAAYIYTVCINVYIRF